MENRPPHKDLSGHIVKINDHAFDLQFWLEKTPEERIDAIEFLRTPYYALCGYTTIPRITKIIHSDKG